MVSGIHDSDEAQMGTPRQPEPRRWDGAYQREVGNVLEGIVVLMCDVGEVFESLGVGPVEWDRRYSRSSLGEADDETDSAGEPGRGVRRYSAERPWWW